MLNFSGNTWGGDIGAFLFQSGNAHLRTLSFPITSAMVAVGIVEGAALEQLETFAREYPKEFFDFTQNLRHDVWAGLKHLSVAFEDVWLRITRPYELVNTSFAKLAHMGQVALIFVIDVHGRSDKPVIASCFQGIARSPDLLRTASAAFSRIFTRHTTHRVMLRHAIIVSGQELSRTDAIYFGTLQYVSTATVLDEIATERAEISSGEPESLIKVTMHDVHNFLFPPPPVVPTERFVATRVSTPSAVNRSSVAIAPTRGIRTVVSPQRQQHHTFVDPTPGRQHASQASPIAVRRREPPWTATSYHNTATADFAPQRTFCTPAAGLQGVRASGRPSIAVTSSPSASAQHFALDDSMDSVASNIHVVSRAVSTPVRRWAQRGVSAPSPSIKL